MSNLVNLSVPSNLAHPFFFKEEKLKDIDLERYQLWNVDALDHFMYEIIYSNNEIAYKPWEHGDEILPILMDHWKKLDDRLGDHYQKRDVKSASPLMKKAIHTCISYVFWLNEKPIVLQDMSLAIMSSEFVPVNFAERFQFVLSRPNLYQSYKTIQQIMIELEKLYAKSIIKKQRRTKAKSAQLAPYGLEPTD